MISWGWSGMAHDASLAVFDDKQLVFDARDEYINLLKGKIILIAVA